MLDKAKERSRYTSLQKIDILQKLPFPENDFDYLTCVGTTTYLGKDVYNYHWQLKWDICHIYFKMQDENIIVNAFFFKIPLCWMTGLVESSPEGLLLSLTRRLFGQNGNPFRMCLFKEWNGKLCGVAKTYFISLCVKVKIRQLEWQFTSTRSASIRSTSFTVFI